MGSSRVRHPIHNLAVPSLAELPYGLQNFKNETV